MKKYNCYASTAGDPKSKQKVLTIEANGTKSACEIYAEQIINDLSKFDKITVEPSSLLSSPHYFNVKDTNAYIAIQQIELKKQQIKTTELKEKKQTEEAKNQINELKCILTELRSNKSFNPKLIPTLIENFSFMITNTDKPSSYPVEAYEIRSSIFEECINGWFIRIYPFFAKDNIKESASYLNYFRSSQNNQTNLNSGFTNESIWPSVFYFFGALAFLFGAILAFTQTSVEWLFIGTIALISNCFLGFASQLLIDVRYTLGRILQLLSNI